MNERLVHLVLGAMLAVPAAALPFCFPSILELLPDDNLGKALPVVLLGLGALEAAAIAPRLRRTPGDFWSMVKRGWISWARIALLGGMLIGLGLTLSMEHQPERPRLDLGGLLFVGATTCAWGALYGLLYGVQLGLIPIYGPIWTTLLRKALLLRRRDPD